MGHDPLLLWVTLSVFCGAVAFIAVRLCYDEWVEHRRHARQAGAAVFQAPAEQPAA